MTLIRTYAPLIMSILLCFGFMSFFGHVVLDVPVVYAQNSGGGPGDDTSTTLTNPLKFSSITCLVLAIIDVVLIFLIPVIVLYIMYAGFLFVKAQGNSEGITDAKRALVAGLIGGVIVLGARTILSVVEGTINTITDTDTTIVGPDSRSCSST
jgi:hypothetical protein